MEKCSCFSVHFGFLIAGFLSALLFRYFQLLNAPAAHEVFSRLTGGAASAADGKDFPMFGNFSSKHRKKGRCDALVASVTRRGRRVYVREPCRSCYPVKNFSNDWNPPSPRLRGSRNAVGTPRLRPGILPILRATPKPWRGLVILSEIFPNIGKMDGWLWRVG